MKLNRFLINEQNQGILLSERPDHQNNNVLILYVKVLLCYNIEKTKKFTQ